MAGTVIPPRRLRAHITDGPALGYILILPGVVATFVLVLGSLTYSAGLSLYSWRLTELALPKRLVGLENYVAMLHDAALGRALLNTLGFVAVAVGVELLTGLVIALTLTQVTVGARLAGALILVPMIITPVVTALMWRYMLDPQFGVVNYALHSLGYGKAVGWLGDQYLAPLSIVAIDIWTWTPFAVLVLHAGILGVSEELLEAARVDGATWWGEIRHIILPQLTPLILLFLLLRTMDAYRIFDTVFVLTQGGPGLATETLSLYVYRTSFKFADMGYGMALSVLTLAIIVVTSFLYLRLLRQRRLI